MSNTNRTSRSGFNAPGITVNDTRTLVNIEGINYVLQEELKLAEERVLELLERAEESGQDGAVTPTQAVLLDVLAEREKQDEKWGEQNHAPIGGDMPSRGRLYYAGRADDWKAINDDRVKKDKMGWDSIALEEVYEAFGAETAGEYREELVQAAAVFVAAIESFDRSPEGKAAQTKAAA